MDDPALFIGLGGAGVDTVARLEEHLKRSVPEADFRSRFRFLFLDTDSYALRRILEHFNAEFQLAPSFINEWVYLGGVNLGQQHAEMQRSPDTPFARDVRRWLDPKVTAGLSNENLVGAHTHRQLGRFALAAQAAKVLSAIDAKVEALALHAGRVNAAGLRIYPVCSSCGGTGSSMLFDLLFMLAAVHQSRFGCDARVRPVIFGPKPFMRAAAAEGRRIELPSRLATNACAFFRELQYAIGAKHRGRPASEIRDELFMLPSSLAALAPLPAMWLPFESAMILEDRVAGQDTVRFRGFAGGGGMYAAAAELIAALVLGSSTAADQLFVNLSSATLHPSYGTFDVYASAGQRVVEFPREPLRSYVRSVFLSEVVSKRLLAAGTRSSAEAREAAAMWLEEHVLDRLSEEKFVGAVRQRTLGAEPLPDLVGLGSIDEFRGAPDEKTGESSIDPQAVTSARLERYLGELDRKLGAMTRYVREQYNRQFGDNLQDLSASQQLGKVRDELREWLEATIDREGVFAWSGTATNRASGLANALAEECEERVKEKLRAHAESNDRYTKKTSGPQGLKALADELARQAEKDRSGGLLGWRRNRASKALVSGFEALAQAEREVVAEALRNVLLTLEIHLLAVVGASTEVPKSLVTVLPSDPTELKTSFAKALARQGERIEAWLVGVANAASADLDAARQALRQLASSGVTEFLPPLETILTAEGKSGAATEEILEDLLGQIANRELLPALTSREGSAPGLRWREIGAREGDVSGREQGRFFEAGKAWVERQLTEVRLLAEKASQNVETLIGNLEERERDELRSRLWSAQPFAEVTSTVTAAGPNLRILVTPSDATAAAPVLLGVGRAGTTHVQESSAPHRLRVVHAFSRIYLEEGFAWWRDLEAEYEKRLDYEPHLCLDGRARFAPGAQGSGPKRFGISAP